jgi:ABC-type branched-subunit amino acid transport system permease subunit
LVVFSQALARCRTAGRVGLPFSSAFSDSRDMPMMAAASVAYALIGGLGSVFGPLIGMVLDIGLLESTRVFHGYRMIVFGGLVALRLLVRPRGLLDERVVNASRM